MENFSKEDHLGDSAGRFIEQHIKLVNDDPDLLEQYNFALSYDPNDEGDKHSGNNRRDLATTALLDRLLSKHPELHEEYQKHINQ